MDSQKLAELKGAVSAKDVIKGKAALNNLKSYLLGFDSLPPMCVDSANATAERIYARDVYEYAVVLSIYSGDKAEFQKYLSMLRPYYTGFGAEISESENKYMIIGLNLLYLIVENRLSEYHCELELITDERKQHPAIHFCTQLEQRLMAGAHDAVMAAASQPPVELYTFLLKGLLETVRVNIGECAEASYRMLSLAAAKNILMFQTEAEAQSFVSQHYPHWEWSARDNAYCLKSSAGKLDSTSDVSSVPLICQSLSYATELDRIV